MAINEAAVVRARGVEIFLGGNPYRLRFDFDMLEQIETKYDGLDNFIDELLSWKKKYRTIRYALTLALSEQLTPEQIGPLLNQDATLLTVFTPILEALSETMGVKIEVGSAESGPDDAPKATGSDDSPGETSTTSPLSVLDGQMPSSGI